LRLLYTVLLALMRLRRGASTRVASRKSAHALDWVIEAH